jgi:hypothetical protein
MASLRRALRVLMRDGQAFAIGHPLPLPKKENLGLHFVTPKGRMSQRVKAERQRLIAQKMEDMPRIVAEYRKVRSSSPLHHQAHFVHAYLAFS